MHWTLQITVLGEVFLSVVFGGLIGLERELAGKPAGLRTHMLVAGSATLLVALGNIIVSEFEFPQFVSADPIRIIQAIIVGISFLGAGTIIQREEKGHVEGLTTAASVLSAAAIGIGVALRLMLLSLGMTFIILVINRVVNFAERWLNSRLNKSQELK